MFSQTRDKDNPQSLQLSDLVQVEHVNKYEMKITSKARYLSINVTYNGQTFSLGPWSSIIKPSDGFKDGVIQVTTTRRHYQAAVNRFTTEFKREMAKINLSNEALPLISQALAAPIDGSVQKVRVQEEPGEYRERDESFSENFNRTALDGIGRGMGQLLVALTASANADRAKGLAYRYERDIRATKAEYRAITNQRETANLKTIIRKPLKRYIGYLPIWEFQGSGGVDINVNGIGLTSVSLAITPEFKISNKLYSRFYGIGSYRVQTVDIDLGSEPVFQRSQAGNYSQLADSTEIRAEFETPMIGIGQFFTTSHSWYFGYQYLVSLSPSRSNLNLLNPNMDEDLPDSPFEFGDSGRFGNSLLKVFAAVRFGQRRGWILSASLIAANHDLITTSQTSLARESEDSFIPIQSITRNGLTLSGTIGLGFVIGKSWD